MRDEKRRKEYEEEPISGSANETFKDYHLRESKYDVLKEHFKKSYEQYKLIDKKK